MKLLAPKFAVLVAVVATLGVTAAPSQASPAHPSSVAEVSTPYAYQGSAYGTRVTLAGAVTSGPSAGVFLQCATSAGIHKTNTAGSVGAAPLLGTGTIDTTADTSAGPFDSRTSANVQNLNLLGGVVTADAVRSVSSTTHQQSAFHTSAAGTTFTSLVVAGVPITGAVDPNTRIDLAGFGYVILNEQTSRVGGRSASLTVNAIHLVIDQTNALGIAPGTNALVAHATSGLGGPVVATLDGFAYGSQAKVGSTVTSGPSFRIPLSCLGTHGQVKVNDGAGVSLPGLLDTGAIHNTAEGTTDGTSASGETTSTVDNANVVSGLVQATTIKADSHASSDGSSFTFSDTGSSFATLSVVGFPNIGANVPANTRLHIAGLGTLWLHRIVHTPNSIEVRMIELIVLHSNTLGLPVGTDVRVAVSHASAH